MNKNNMITYFLKVNENREGIRKQSGMNGTREKYILRTGQP
jgi:hypothetical protein